MRPGRTTSRRVSSRVTRRAEGIEILINTPHIADLILKCNIGSVKEAMEGSGAKGMQTFDIALLNLYKEERIDLETRINVG